MKSLGLVSSGKDISELNKQYETKIKTLEQVYLLT